MAVILHLQIETVFINITIPNDAGVKPVLGLEAYVAARKMTDRDPAHDKQRFHITLLAMNNQGFENLCILVRPSSKE